MYTLCFTPLIPVLLKLNLRGLILVIKLRLVIVERAVPSLIVTLGVFPPPWAHLYHLIGMSESLAAMSSVSPNSPPFSG